jgi:hypothetical protein
MNTTHLLVFAWIGLSLIACRPGAKDSQETEENGSSGPVRLYRENTRYLEYRGDPIILITSAEHYGALVNMDFDYKTYLETLGSEGFNYTRIFTGTYIEPVDNIFGITRNTLAPKPGRYLAPWVKAEGKYDLDRFNPDYFVRLKDLLSEAQKHGIVVEVTLFTSIYVEDHWELCPFNHVNNINGVGDMDFHRVNTLYSEGLQEYQEAFIRKVVREVNSFDNIFFEIQNEPWADNGCLAAYVNQEDDLVFSRPWQKKVEVANRVAMEWQEWVVSVIRDEEAGLPKSHLIAQNICNYEHELEILPEGVSLVNFHYAHPGASLMNLELGGVIGLDETGFMPHEDYLYINQAWRMILSGAGLYNNLDYSFAAGNEKGDWPIPEANPGWGGPGFRKKLAVLVETMQQVPFHEMEFSGSILEGADNGMKQYGLQKQGESYLVFLEHMEGAPLIPLVPSSTYTVTFINVDTGERKSETLPLGDGASVLSPFTGDRLALLIRKAE